MKTENKENHKCDHKLKCEKCNKSFSPLTSAKPVVKEKETTQFIRKTTNINVSLYIQPERRGFFKWLCGLFW